MKKKYFFFGMGNFWNLSQMLYRRLRLPFFVGWFLFLIMVKWWEDFQLVLFIHVDKHKYYRAMWLGNIWLWYNTHDKIYSQPHGQKSDTCLTLREHSTQKTNSRFWFLGTWCVFRGISYNPIWMIMILLM